MKTALEKKSIIKKTLQVGANTLVSRIIGLAREIFLMRYLGLGVLADGFTVAFMLPNSLRKIFAEGALTSAFVPTFITLFKKEGREQANALTTLSFIAFESALLVFCALVMWKAHFTAQLFAPGFSESQLEATVLALRILMPFIFFVSVSALLSGAMQAVHHFFVPAFSQILLNVVFVGALIVCIEQKLSVEYLCFAILGSGALQCLMHIVKYFQLGFSFGWWNAETLKYFFQVIGKFLLCFLSMSVMEINLIVDQRFASWLPTGTVTLIKYANRFMGIPLGVFAVAFSTILLPHFTHVKMESPEKLKFHFMESTKLILWITIPASLILGYLSTEIFQTLFVSVSPNFPVERIDEAGMILIGFLLGLCFFSLNKILFNLFFTFHDAWYPMVISVIATAFNFVSNYYLMKILGSFGLALSTSLSGFLQMSLAFIFLKTQHNLSLDVKEISTFLMRYILQVLVFIVPFYYAYHYLYAYIATTHYAYFFTQSFGFWAWICPLGAIFLGLLYGTHKQFGLSLYFLNKFE